MNVTSQLSEAADAGGVAAREDGLRKACVQLEAVFLQELMKALRDTVPESGLGGGGAGEDIFSSMLDAQLTETMAQRMERGLAAALYRQLRGPGADAAAGLEPAALEPPPAPMRGAERATVGGAAASVRST